MKQSAIFPGLLSALLIGTAAQAAPVLYDDEAAFVAATNPETFHDFNDDDASFAGSSVSIGNMTFSGPLHPFLPNLEHFANYIGPQGIDNGTVNGTHAVYGYSRLGASMRIDFIKPITSFGALFYDLGEKMEISEIRFLDADDETIAGITMTGFDYFDVNFRGIDLDGQAASAMQFVSTFAPNDFETFAMDNVHFSTGRGISPAPVPLPAGSLLLLSGAAAFGALKRKRA